MGKKIAESNPTKEEILQYLLIETGQKKVFPTDVDKIISHLKLQVIPFDFSEFSSDALKNGRAILSYNDRVIMVNKNMGEHRINFSKFHEVAHFVLPNHREAFYICDDDAMSSFPKLTYEAEANAFAADLIYKGDIFTTESNSMEVSFESIMILAERYNSSIVSTTWRFVERSLYPCVFVCYEKTKEVWKVKYCIFSKRFLEKYLENKDGVFTDDNSEDVIKAELQQNRIVKSECKINFGNEREKSFNCEYYYNNYNVLSLIKEK